MAPREEYSNILEGKGLEYMTGQQTRLLKLSLLAVAIITEAEEASTRPLSRKIAPKAVRQVSVYISDWYRLTCGPLSYQTSTHPQCVERTHLSIAKLLKSGFHFNVRPSACTDHELHIYNDWALNN